MKRIHTYVKQDINNSNIEPGMRRKCQFYRYFKEQEPYITQLIGEQITMYHHHLLQTEFLVLGQ